MPLPHNSFQACQLPHPSGRPTKYSTHRFPPPPPGMSGKGGGWGRANPDPKREGSGNPAPYLTPFFVFAISEAPQIFFGMLFKNNPRKFASKYPPYRHLCPPPLIVSMGMGGSESYNLRNENRVQQKLPSGAKKKHGERVRGEVSVRLECGLGERIYKRFFQDG